MGEIELAVMGTLHNLQGKAIVLCGRDLSIRFGTVGNFTYFDNPIDHVDRTGIIEWCRRICKIEITAFIIGIQYLTNERGQNRYQLTRATKAHLRMIVRLYHPTAITIGNNFVDQPHLIA